MMMGQNPLCSCTTIVKIEKLWWNVKTCCSLASFLFLLYLLLTFLNS